MNGFTRWRSSRSLEFTARAPCKPPYYKWISAVSSTNITWMISFISLKLAYAELPSLHSQSWCEVVLKTWHICRPDLILPSTPSTRKSKEFRPPLPFSSCHLERWWKLAHGFPPSLPCTYTFTMPALPVLYVLTLLPFLQLNLENAFATPDGAENGFTRDSQALSGILYFFFFNQGVFFIFSVYALWYSYTLFFPIRVTILIKNERRIAELRCALFLPPSRSFVPHV